MSSIEKSIGDRPRVQDFRGLVGFAASLRQWHELASTNRLPPVLLLEGRVGLGKRKLAAALAAWQTCDTLTDHGACGQCRGCAWFLTGEHPEVFWLEHSNQPGASPTYGVDVADQLQEHLSLKPSHSARSRVAVLIDADLLTLQAANRLLKLLEEPPDSATIILTTSRRRQLPPTLLSRLVRWFIAPPALDGTRALLQIAYRESYGTEPTSEYLEGLLRRSALAPELALALLQAEVSEDGAAVGLAQAESLTALLAEGDFPARLAAAETLGRAKELSTLAMLQGLEIHLNERYREASRNAYESKTTYAALRRRRAILQQVKRLASRGRVPLNTQLIAEAIATCQL